MRAGHLWLAVLVCCPLAGWPLLAHSSYRRFSVACRLGLAFATGAVLISAWMTLFALAGLAWKTLPIFGLAALTAYLFRFLLRTERAAGPIQEEKRPSGLPGRFAIPMTAAALLSALAATTSAAATSTDLLSFWGPKAQAFAAARTVDAAFLSDPHLGYLHVSYPPLVTNLYALASIVAGRFAWGAATLTFPLCLGALALALPGVLRTATPRRIALAASTFIVSALGFLGNDVDVAGNGEPWLWLFELLAMALLVGDAVPTRSGQVLAGLLLAGAVTAKVEGLPFALAAAVLFLLIRRKEVRLGSAAAFLLTPSAVSLGAWLAFGATRGLFHGYEQYGRLLEIHWNELSRVLSALGSAFWSAGWALPWLFPLAALAVSAKKSSLALLPLVVCVVLAAFFVFTYLHLPDASQWIGWSAGRVFSPLLAFLAVAVLCQRARQR